MAHHNHQNHLQDLGSNYSDRYHHLNVNLPVPQILLTHQGMPDETHTPNTPEILNSIVNMHTGPFNEYRNNDTDPPSNTSYLTLQGASNYSSMGPNYILPTDVDYRSNIGIEHFQRSKVKLPVASTGASSFASSTEQTNKSSKTSREDISEEEIQRRLRRRERNKVAATKCRNKKKMKNQELVKESEVLENHNQYLKSEIHRLEQEKRHLMQLLAENDPSNAIRLGSVLPSLNLQSAPGYYRGLAQRDDIESRPSIDDPPSFSDALRLVRLDGGSNIKVEEEDEESMLPIHSQMMYYED